MSVLPRMRVGIKPMPTHSLCEDQYQPHSLPDFNEMQGFFPQILPHHGVNGDGSFRTRDCKHTARPWLDSYGGSSSVKKTAQAHTNNYDPNPCNI